MKILVCLAAILVVSEAGFPHLSLLRGLGRENSGVSLLDYPEYSEQCANGAIRECISCTEAKLCLPNGHPIAKVNCSSYSPSTPFCNPKDGLCTASAPSSCVKSPFQCPPQDGVYPDPEDCAQFHYCANSQVTTVSCPRNNVYDHSQGTCKLRRWAVDCVKFNCANREGQDVVYPKDDSIWATCAGGNAYIMGRCEDYESYNVAQRKCTRVCRVVGNQPIKGVCDGYVRCAEVGSGKLEPVTFPCPPGQGFDEESRECSSKASCLSQTDDNGSGNGTGSLASRIVNNSGSNNANNNVENGNDSVDGNLVNGNNNGNNYNSGNVGSGNQGGALFSSRINNSGNDNADNDVENGNDDTNGNLVNGNDNSENVNAGNVGSVNQGGLTPRIINNAGNDNNGNNVSNGDDDVNGNLINGNNNGNSADSGNVGYGNQRGLSSRIINSSGDSNGNQTIVNGDDNTNGSIVNGNDNNNNENSHNVGTGNVHGRTEDLEGNNDNGEDTSSPNLIESLNNMLKWLRNRIG